MEGNNDKMSKKWMKIMITGGKKENNNKWMKIMING